MLTVYKTLSTFTTTTFGLLTPYGLSVLSDYATTMPNELLILAMQKAVDANARNMNYIKGILNNWEKEGIKTVLQAQEEEQAFKNKTESREETREEAIARKTRELEEAMKNANK